MMNHAEEITDRAENLRLAEVLGSDTVKNINYEDAAVAPNAAYGSARSAAHFAGQVLKIDEEGRQ